MRNFFEKLGLGIRYLIGMGLITLGSLYAYHLSSSLAIFFSIVLIFSGFYILPIIYEVVGILSKTFLVILIILGLMLPPGLNQVLKPRYDTDSINYYKVTTSVLNVRKGEGTGYPVIAKLHEGDVVVIEEFSDEWNQIKIDDKIGYISNEFIKKYENPDGWTTFLISSVVFFIIYFKVGGSIFSSSDSHTNRGGNFVRSDSKGNNYASSGVHKKGSSNLSKGTQNKMVESKPSKKEEHICKYCGTKRSSIFFLTQDSCSKSPSKRHQPFEGGIQSEYVCKYCGTKQDNLFFLTQNTCSKSPSKYHQPFEGGIQSEYVCKYCGTKQSNLFFLTQNTCSKSPSKYHQPLYNNL